VIIGIDIGSTTTKAVSIENGALVKKIKTRAADAVTSATGAFGKLILENGIKMSDIEGIMITGAGASKLGADIFGIPAHKVDEITAIGIGGMFLSGKEHIDIATVGTGTAFTAAGGDRMGHLGGSGVGGGTVQGLARRLLPVSDFSGIMELAASGNLKQVDLLLEDIMDTRLSFLDGTATASNFGKMLDSAGPGDIALGLINLDYQVIGMLAVFAAKSTKLNRVVVTGRGGNNPIGKQILSGITAMYGIEFEYPADGEYTTAAGAGLSGAHFSSRHDIV
jgi:type II pantothenate kinase